MITKLDEPIKAGVIFGNGKKIKPVWFIWNNNRYNITDITYSWLSKEGRALLYCFSVTDGSTLFEISYNSETLNWKLNAVEVG